MHLVKEDCKAKVQKDSRPARYIIYDFENAEKFFQRETDSVVPRIPRQIYNFQQNVSKNKTKDDDLLDIVVEMLNQAKDSSSFLSPIDPDQPFICEFLYQSGGQPIFVLFSDQNLNDINRFCTDICPFPVSDFGSDDCEELYEGILSQTSKTIHLLGVSHVMKSIEDWLRDSSQMYIVHSQKTQLENQAQCRVGQIQNLIKCCKS